MKPRYANRAGLRARYLGTLAGRKVWEWPVEATFGAQSALTQDDRYRKYRFRIIARTGAEAADFTAGLLDQEPCVEISVWGQRAGLAAHRFWGWDRAIWNQLCAAAAERQQLNLNLKGTHHD